MMTGHASIESAVEALKRGAHDYFGKPFEHDELVKRVENALDQRRLRAERDVFRKKFETSEERYRYLVQHSPDIIFTLGAKGEFLFVNDTVESLLDTRARPCRARTSRPSSTGTTWKRSVRFSRPPGKRNPCRIAWK